MLAITSVSFSGVLAVSLGALAGCAANAPSVSPVQLSSGDIVTIAPKQVSRYTCAPNTLVCESIAGGGRFARRQCSCAGVDAVRGAPGR